jgi:hypothetical protein
MSGWMPPISGRVAATCALAALCMAGVACATPYEQGYGHGYRDYNAATIANPEAGANDLEARRPDGQSTDAALYKMREHEPKVEEGEPPPVINVNVGNR